MTALSIFGRKSSKLSPLESERLSFSDLVCGIGVWIYQAGSNDDYMLTSTYLTSRSNLFRNVSK